ncbi:MAG: hypothetical protein U1F17_06600 [Burkholderiaceae bacterium]
MTNSKTSSDNWGSRLRIEHRQRVDGPLSTIRRGAIDLPTFWPERTAPGVVRQPRNFLIYRTRIPAVIGRLLHDAMEMVYLEGKPWE